MSLYASFNGTLTTTIDEVESILTHTSWRYRGPHEIKAVGKSALLRGVTDSQQSKTVSSIRALAKAAQDLAQVANQSTQLINDAIGGHVLIRREPGGTNEILIMDHPDPDQAVKIWRWNMGGLGYSDNVTGADNPAREYDVAMTMDGAINANFITTGKLIADVVQIGPETTFEAGYDPSEKETPEGAQQKAEAAEAAAKAYAEAEAAAAKQAAKEHASGLLQSLANGEYSGTFINGTSIISPTVVGLQGTFAELMAGNPFGARLELGESAGEPFLAAFDSAMQRVKLEKDKIRFWDHLGRDGGLLSAERLIDTDYDYDLAQLRLISPAGVEVGVLPPGVDPEKDYFNVGFRAIAYDGELSCSMRVYSLGVEGWESVISSVSCSNRGVRISPGANQSVWFSQTDLHLTYPYPFDEVEEEYYAIIGTRPEEWGRKYLRLRSDAGSGGRINLYGERDPNYPGDVAIYTGDRETIRIYQDNSIRINTRCDGGYTIHFDRSGTYGGNSRPTIRPNKDTFGFIGTSTHRFYQMFAQGGFLTSSEKRLKTNIALADKASCYDQVKALQFKTYKLKGEIENAPDGAEVPTYIGVIAEEAPDIVCDKEKKNINLYPYISLIGVAVQEIQGRLEAIENRLAISKQ